LQRGGGKFADYLMWQRSQGTGPTIKELLQIIIRHSDRPRENHGEDIVRRLRQLQNVPDSKGFFQRMGRVQLVLSSVKMENITQQRRGPWKSYSGSTFLAQK